MNRIARILIVAVSLTLSGGAAWAASGTGVVLEKNLSNRSLLVNGTTWISVSPETIIRGADGRLMSFEELPAGTKIPHGYKTVGDEAIEYEADEVNGKLVARTIRVRVGNVD